MEHTVALQPFADTPVLVASSTRGFVKVDAFPGIEENYPYKVARGVMDIPSICPFYSPIVNTSYTAIELAKR